MHTKCHSKHIVETLPHFLGPNDLCWYIWPVMEEEDQDLASEFLIFVFWISYLENSTSFECFQNLLEVFFLLFHFWQNQFSNTFRVSLRNSEYALRFRLKTRQLLGCTFTRPYTPITMCTVDVVTKLSSLPVRKCFNSLKNFVETQKGRKN